MSFKLSSAALVLMLAAGAASAETIMTQTSGVVSRGDATATVTSNSGSEMLAKLARVTPGKYTNNEMLRIDEARRAGDARLVAYYLNHENREGWSQADNAAAKAQLAGSLGLDPAQYTLAELVTIQARDAD